jgi:hypothetical protein
MYDFLLFALFMALYVVVMRWVLPRVGVPT